MQPEWLEQVKKLQAWWSARSEVVPVASLLKLMEQANEEAVSQGMVSWLRVVDVAEGLCCEIRCLSCNSKV